MRLTLAVLGSLILSAIIGYVDVVTGQEIVVTVFYLIPISIAVWYGGNKYGFFVAALCSSIWFYTETVNGREYSSRIILVWDTLVLAAFLFVFAFMLYEIQKLLVKERSLSRTDYLTELANRRQFFESVDAEISRASRSDSWFTIAYIDVDDFKLVNDNMGHQAGDRALILIARALKEHTRKMDITARIGGDEFAVLLPSAGSQDAEKIMEKIQASINGNMKKDGFSTTCSIGAVVFNKFPGSTDNALKMADSIMYEVKQGGKNALKFLVY
jgi:diguanylate cyclase (GGDEF)-like protein